MKSQKIDEISITDVYPGAQRCEHAEAYAHRVSPIEYGITENRCDESDIAGFGVCLQEGGIKAIVGKDDPQGVRTDRSHAVFPANSEDFFRHLFLVRLSET